MREQRHLYTVQGELHYTLERKRIKHSYLRVHDDGSLAISAPQGMRIRDVEAMIEDRLEWIARSRARLAARSAVPETPAAACVKDRFHRAIDRVWPLVEGEGFARPALRIRRMKTRWGSCTPSAARICLNSALFYVEEECLDYVVLHELAHFIHLNHSKDFWRYVEVRMPDWKKRRARLRTYRLS